MGTEPSNEHVVTIVASGCRAWKIPLTKMQSRRGSGVEASTAGPVCGLGQVFHSVLCFRPCIGKVDSFKRPDKVVVKPKWDHV